MDSRRTIVLVLALTALVMALSSVAFTGAASACVLHPYIKSEQITPAQPIEGEPTTIEVEVTNPTTCGLTNVIVSFLPSESSAEGANAIVGELEAGQTVTEKLTFTFPHAGFDDTVTYLKLFGQVSAILSTHHQLVLVTKPTLDFGFERQGRGTCESVICTEPAQPVAGVPVTSRMELFDEGPVAAGPFSVVFTPNVGRPLTKQTQKFAGQGLGFLPLGFTVTYAKPGTYTRKAELLPTAGDFKTSGLPPTTVEQPITVVEGSSDLSFENPDGCDSALCIKEAPVVENKDSFSVEIHNKGPEPAATFTVKLKPSEGKSPVSQFKVVKGLAVGESRTLTFPTFRYPKKGLVTATAEIKPADFKNIGQSKTQEPLLVNERSAVLSVELDSLIAFVNPSGYEEWDLDYCFQYKTCFKKHVEPVLPNSGVEIGQADVIALSEGEKLNARVNTYSTDYTCFIHCFFEHDAFPGHATVSLSRHQYLAAASGPLLLVEPGKDCREEEHYLPLGPIVNRGECFEAIYTVTLLDHLGNE